MKLRTFLVAFFNIDHDCLGSYSFEAYGFNLAILKALEEFQKDPNNRYENIHETNIRIKK